MMADSLFMQASIKRLGQLRSRLAREADSTITAALSCLWEKETERSGMAIQKEMDRSKSDQARISDQR